MLTKEQIYKLNRQMAAGGAPDVKDDMGYNKPDYIIMAGPAKKNAYSLSNEEYCNIAIKTKKGE